MMFENKVYCKCRDFLFQNFIHEQNMATFQSALDNF